MSDINRIVAKIRLNRKYKCAFCGVTAIGETEQHDLVVTSTDELNQKLKDLPIRSLYMPDRWGFNGVYHCGCTTRPRSTRKFKVLDSSNLPMNVNFDGQVLDFIRDLPDLGQVCLLQTNNGGVVSFDYANVEEVFPNNGDSQ